MVKSRFSIFYNNIVCINCNLENVELLLQILMRAKPIQASQVMFLSMCQHHWLFKILRWSL